MAVGRQLGADAGRAAPLNSLCVFASLCVSTDGAGPQCRSSQQHGLPGACLPLLRLWCLQYVLQLSRGARHSWSRLKVDIGEGPTLPQRCFEDINGCIDASTEKRKRVLVHCRDGYSLAPVCVIQYLMVRQNMRLIAAYELLRAKYPVNIRECHQNVLVSLERALRPGTCLVLLFHGDVPAYMHELMSSVRTRFSVQ
uniref:Tyrosine specific protein phosphatases domain-containing protein n=1 Tax=Scleropages formosus TaxID=113540 RepID=A0A8C9QRG7_SCLFO